MGKNVFKFTIAIIIIMIFLIGIPYIVFGESENMNIIHTNDSYIIYIENAPKEEFDFAISSDINAQENNLNFTKTVEDGEGNQVILISSSKYESIKNQTNYLYAKSESGKLMNGKEIIFSESFEVDDLAKAETITNRIETEIVSNVLKEEETEGIKYKTTIGGLKVINNEEKKVYYSRTKLPQNKYTELKQMINKVNTEYNDINMFEKINLIKQLDKLYKELETEQNWLEVVNNIIVQPEDANKGDEYILFLKTVDEQGNEITDVKLMISSRTDSEQVIPATTEKKTISETSKLPVTGDSVILFIILAVIIIIAVVVFIRINYLKENK